MSPEFRDFEKPTMTFTGHEIVTSDRIHEPTTNNAEVSPDKNNTAKAPLTQEQIDELTTMID